MSDVEKAGLTVEQQQRVAEDLWHDLVASVEGLGGNRFDAPGVVAMMLATCASKFAPDHAYCLSLISGCALSTMGEAEAKLAALAATPAQGRA